MASPRSIDTPEDAEVLLAEIGAPERLITHGRLVLEAADALLDHLRACGAVVDERFVRVGAMLHDVGKTLNLKELSGPGANHELAGERLLLEMGVDPAIARCCVSHAQWATMPCSLEELLVALADALWKGVRRDKLEQRVIEEVARLLHVEVWSLFVRLDNVFERIASDGEQRLRRSA